MCAWVCMGQGEEEEERRGGGGVGGVHPNQSTSLPPALSAKGPADFCMQPHSRSQLEPSLPRLDKDSSLAALPASPISAASPQSTTHTHTDRAGEKNTKQRLLPVRYSSAHIHQSCYLLHDNELFFEVPMCHIHLLMM